MSEQLQSRYPTPRSSPGLALWHVTNGWQRAIRAALVPHDLTHVQFVLLATLTAMDPGLPPTQRELATATEVDVMMASNVLRTLEKKGLITRSPHPTDSRANLLSPTAEGVALARAANSDVENVDALYFAALKSKQLDALLNYLHTLHTTTHD